MVAVGRHAADTEERYVPTRLCHHPNVHTMGRQDRFVPVDGSWRGRMWGYLARYDQERVRHWTGAPLSTITDAESWMNALCKDPGGLPPRIKVQCPPRGPPAGVDRSLPLDRAPPGLRRGHRKGFGPKHYIEGVP